MAIRVSDCRAACETLRARGADGWPELAREADTDPPDEVFVRSARSGDPRAREKLFERYTPMIVSEARSFRHGSDSTDASPSGWSTSRH